VSPRSSPRSRTSWRNGLCGSASIWLRRSA